jgi:histidinol-phosphate aminotransferase
LMSLFAPLRTIFSLSSIALAGASAALHDDEHIRRAVENNAEQAEFLRDGLHRLGLPVAQTWANFFYCELREDAAECAGQLRERGIIVQPLGLWGAARAIRVSIGTPQQNQGFLTAMEVFCT